MKLSSSVKTVSSVLALLAVLAIIVAIIVAAISLLRFWLLFSFLSLPLLRTLVHFSSCH